MLALQEQAFVHHPAELIFLGILPTTTPIASDLVGCWRHPRADIETEAFLQLVVRAVQSVEEQLIVVTTVLRVHTQTVQLRRVGKVHHHLHQAEIRNLPHLHRWNGLSYVRCLCRDVSIKLQKEKPRLTLGRRLEGIQKADWYKWLDLDYSEKSINEWTDERLGGRSMAFYILFLFKKQQKAAKSWSWILHVCIALTRLIQPIEIKTF